MVANVWPQTSTNAFESLVLCGVVKDRLTLFKMAALINVDEIF